MKSVGRFRPIATLGTVVLALIIAGCGGRSAQAAPSAPAPAASQASVASAAAGSDTSTSSVTNVCKVISLADVGTAFGGTWHILADYNNGAPLTCGLSDGPHGLSIELRPGGYAESGMSLGTSVDGLGEQASILANTLWIKRGADDIIVVWLSTMTPTIPAGLVTLGKAIYPKF